MTLQFQEFEKFSLPAAKSITYLKRHARGFVFTVASPPGLVGAGLESLRLMEEEPERHARLWRNAERLISGLKGAGFRITPTQTPIVSILCGSDERTLDFAKNARDGGLLVLPIFYPAVPMNSPRVRLSVSAAHTESDIDFALEILIGAGRSSGLLPRGVSFSI